MSIRTFTRACAVSGAVGVIALSISLPASAHVGGTASDASAGAYTIFTMSVPHGCEESPTTKIEIQIPESVLSVTPTRNPLWDVKSTIVKLDEPTTDAHGNEVTERTSSVVYTANTPLPDGQRDAFELSFQVPDAVGETLTFPTVQTCEKGETGWIEVPADGQDAHELEHPAPAFEITAAAEEDGHLEATATKEESDEAAASDTSTDDAEADASGNSNAIGIAGLVAGLLGLIAGGLALARSRTKA